MISLFAWLKIQSDQTMTEQHLKRVTATSILASVLLIGCGEVDPLGTPYTPTPGKLWRWSAEGATGMSGTVMVSVLDASTGEPFYKDHCLCINYHALLTAVLTGLTDLGPSSEALLEMMETATVEACQDRAIEMGLSSNTCAAAVEANYPPTDLGEPCDANREAHTFDPNPYGCGPIPDDSESGETTSPLTPLDELALHVSCSMNSCVVSEEIVLWTLDSPEEYMLGNEAVVERVALTGGAFGFEFTAVSSGSLAEALGFEEEDIITQINTIDVGDLDNWPAIASSLVEADTAVISYLRNGTGHTLIVTIDD